MKLGNGRVRTLGRWKFLVWEKLSRLTRLKAKNHCQRCGKWKETKKMQAHHLVPKSQGNYARFCEDNIVSLCHYCHHRWWHGQSVWEDQRDLIEKWIGLTRYQEIKFLSNKRHSYTEEEYDVMLKDLTKRVKEIEAEGEVV